MGRYGACNTCCTKAPPQMIHFGADYQVYPKIPTRKAGDCTQGSEYEEVFSGITIGYKTMNDLNTWYADTRDKLWKAYNEWFSDPNNESLLNSYEGSTTGILGITSVKIPARIRHNGACGNLVEPIPSLGSILGLSHYDWVSPSELKDSYWVPEPASLPTYPTGKTRYNWNVLVMRHGLYPRELLEAGGEHRMSFVKRSEGMDYPWEPDKMVVAPFVDGLLRLNVAGRAWYVGAGKSLWDVGARKIIVKYNRSWAKQVSYFFGSPPSQPKYHGTMLRVIWQCKSDWARSNVCDWNVEFDRSQCFDLTPVEDLCGVDCFPGDEPPEYVDSLSAGLMTSVVTNSNYTVADEPAFGEVVIALLAAEIPTSDIDNPSAWSDHFHFQFRTTLQYRIIGTLTGTDWFNGESEPTNTFEFSSTDSADLQWKPTNPNANAIAVVVTARAALQKVSSNPFPSSPLNGSVNDTYFSAKFAGWTVLGETAFRLEDANGNAIE